MRDSTGERYDFANILFAGPCNRRCPFCIGEQLPDHVNIDNRDVWPLRGIDAFVEAVNAARIPNVVFTGTVTDPHLYRHEGRLLDWLREVLHDGVRFSIHTNGVLTLKKLDVFDRYDRACISFPSFEPETYEAMMGSRRVPDLARIIAEASIPVKVSCVINEHNVDALDAFVARCQSIGVERLVVRKLFGETRQWDVLGHLPVVRHFRGNPVMDCDGMEVTYWDFDEATCKSINLFADGTLGRAYLLTDTAQFRGRAPSPAPPR